MARNKKPEELSEDELRWLLLEKRRSSRQERLERYRRSGRVVMVASDLEKPALDSWLTTPLSEDEDISTPASRPRGRRILDGFLFVVEIGAVIGFLFILFNGLSLIQELNREVAQALDQPTLTPTPLIMAVVLPSGHTPPNSQGGAQFNVAEIPEHLRPKIQRLAEIVLPTPGPEQATRLQIPAIRVDAPVVQGDSWEQLKKGVGQHLGSANPGENSNLVLSAHNDIFGEIFRELDRLKPGDPVTVFTNQRAYHYIVIKTEIVEPTRVDVLAPTNQPTLTLISCYPYMVDNRRIVVMARLQSGGG